VVLGLNLALQAMMGGRSKIWFFYPTWYAFVHTHHIRTRTQQDSPCKKNASAFPIALQAFVLLWRQLRYGKLTPPGT
jgi:hypothetical protein